MSLATLGDSSTRARVTFEVTADRVRTWHDAKISHSSRWHTHQVHQGTPVREFLGPGMMSLSLAVRLDADRGINPEDELAALRLANDTGEVLPFVRGGEFVGDFTIESFSEEWRRVDKKGKLQAVTVELRLEQYA